MMPDLLKVFVNLCARIYKKEFQYPIQCEENAMSMSFKEKIWFAYKMYCHPMERAEKGKRIEEYFKNQNFDFPPPPGFREDSCMTLSAGGDMLSSRDANPGNTHGFWDEARDFLFDADICCANLETPVVPSKPATFLPNSMLKEIALNNSTEMFDMVHQSGKGINLFSTANNHSLDMGPDGLLETLAFLDNKGCHHVGTAASEEERENFPVVEKNGVRIAFLSYTYALNKHALPEGKEYLVNYVRLNKPGADISMIERHVRKARLERGADIVVASLHFSTEFDSYPLQNVIDMAHRVMNLGIDVIIGNHAHGIQPMEKYSFTDPFTGQKKDGLIAYALGDLISCTEKTGTVNSRINCLLRLKISKGSLNGRDTALVTRLNIRPMYFYTKMENGVCTDYRIIKLVKLLGELEAGDNRMGFCEDTVVEVKRLGALAKRVLHFEVSA